MPPPAATNRPGTSESRERADGQGHRTTKHRYRTVIPAPSGNYAFIKTIGQGSMGKVKLARKEGTNELASPHRAALARSSPAHAADCSPLMLLFFFLVV